MAKRKQRKRPSGNRNASSHRSTRANYTPAELFMAGCGALILVMLLGIVVTAMFGG